MVDMKFRECTEAEFEIFIEQYPPKNKLKKSVLTIAEPPIVQFEDVTMDKPHPESIVAQYADVLSSCSICETQLKDEGWRPVRCNHIKAARKYWIING